MRVEIAGVSFKNPVIAASGTFGFGLAFSSYFDVALLGGVALKAVTLRPRQGNPSPRVTETPMGMLNAVGLQNPGVHAFLEKELPLLEGKKLVKIANVAGSEIEDYAETVRLVAGSAVDMIELNISCPNVKRGGISFGVDAAAVGEIVFTAKKNAGKKPLMVKLTPNVTNIVEIALAAEAAGADALSLINTLSAMAIDARARRIVLANVTGGLSGPAIKPVALRMVYDVARAVNIPVVGMGGISSGTDAAEFLLAGARAVMVGTAGLANPLAVARILLELEEYLREQGFASAEALIGALR
jgi:dihydroorotate dehydrogenase (NAD+) catalytic subunit